MKTQEFKEQLACVFDDNLRTKQWHNYADWVIIGFILLSTLEVFLSTYDGIVEKYGKWLYAIDVITTVFFTVEVSLRIWCADLSDERYKGFWGRVKYCFTFYGMIDILSTYTFFPALFSTLPYEMLKVLRVSRLFRLFRYLKAFSILRRAIDSKKKEMGVSLEFLCIITLILSFFLFFLEHSAQPQVYDNGWTSVVWAFAQYIGDPGGFADTPPITVGGRLIACIIGVLGIAIFAVPAGLIASGFSEAMEESAREEQLDEYHKRMCRSFGTNSSRSIQVYLQKHPIENKEAWDYGIKFNVIDQYCSVAFFQMKGISFQDILATCNKYVEFRVKNLANTICSDNRMEDRFVVEHFPVNRRYGFFKNRGSRVTIVSTSSRSEVGTGLFSYYLAKFAGFNYISKDLDAAPLLADGFYNMKAKPLIDGKSLEELLVDKKNNKENIAKYYKKERLREEFLTDLESVTQGEDTWVFCILSQLKNQQNLADIHVSHSTANGKYDAVHDNETFQKLFDHLSDTMQKEQKLSVVMSERYPLLKEVDKDGNIRNQNLVFKLQEDGCQCNGCTLRVSSDITARSSTMYLTIYLMAKALKEVLAPNIPLLEEDIKDLNRSGKGYMEQEIDKWRDKIEFNYLS